MCFCRWLGSWSNFKARKQIIGQTRSREILLLLMDIFFFFFKKKRTPQTLFLFLGSWRAQKVPAPAQPQSKLREPRGLSAKGSSFCTKNMDIVCRRPRAALRGVGWLTRSLQQLGPKISCRVPGWGLLGTAAGGGQFFCMLAPAPSVDIATGQRTAAVEIPPLLRQEGWCLV